MLLTLKYGLQFIKIEFVEGIRPSLTITFQNMPVYVLSRKVAKVSF